MIRPAELSPAITIAHVWLFPKTMAIALQGLPVEGRRERISEVEGSMLGGVIARVSLRSSYHDLKSGYNPNIFSISPFLSPFPLFAVTSSALR